MANTISLTTSLSEFTTTNLSEGNNLYFTEQRVKDVVAPDSDFQPVGTGDNVSFNQVSTSRVENLSGDIVLTAAGDILIEGTAIQIDKEVIATDNFLLINQGETGSAQTANWAGTEIDQGSGTPYRWAYKLNDWFRVGKYETQLNVSTVSGTFSFNERVEGGTSGTWGYVQE